MSRFSLIIILFMAIVSVIIYVVLSGSASYNNSMQSNNDDATKSSVSSYKRYSAPPKMNLEPGKDYSALLKTSKGDIKIDLFEKEAPIAVNNFVFLANEGFYNGTKFHRIIKGFMIQGGDPLGNGTGGPGYKFDDEPITREYVSGTIAMANRGPNTNGSQFFIMHGNGGLEKKYVIFGKVSEGFDVVDKIANIPVRESVFGEKSQPLEDVVVNFVEISVK